MKEEKLQVFIDGVQKYFAQMIIGEELVVGTPYLIENKIPSAKDFTGVIAISGKNQGVVYFTAPRELLERLLVLIGEKDTSEALMVDLVGEVANTIAGKARPTKSCCRARTAPSLSRLPGATAAPPSSSACANSFRLP